MIRTVAALLTLVLTTGCVAQSDEKARGADEDGLPDITLAGFDGAEAVDLGEVTGPTVITLWASYCGACREEMPLLEEFHTTYGDRVDLLGIDYQDQQTEEARALVEETGVTYPLVSDQGGDINGQGGFPAIRALPVIAFVDAEGTVTHVEASVIESVDELVELVEEHLGVDL